jgi:outer membrane protein assembly factor BamB
MVFLIKAGHEPGETQNMIHQPRHSELNRVMRGCFCVSVILLIAESLCFGSARDFGFDDRSFTISWERQRDSMNVTKLDRAEFLGEQRVLISGEGLHLVALDFANGITVWQRMMPHSALAVSDGESVIIANSAGVTGLSAQGNTLWTNANLGTIDSLVAGRSLVVGKAADERSISAVDPQSGILLWKYTVPIRISETPCVGRSTCLVALRDKRLVALRNNDGHAVWEIALTEPIEGGIRWGDDCYFVVTTDATVHAIRESDGSTVWQHRVETEGPNANRVLNATVAPALLGNNICLVSSVNRFKLQVLDRRDGKQQFSTSLGGPLYQLPIAIGTLGLFSVNEAQRIWHIIDLERSIKLYRLGVPADTHILGLKSNRLLVASTDRLIALDVHPALLKSFREMQLPSDALVLSITLAVLGVLATGSVIFGVVGRPRVPPRHETHLRFFALFGTIVIACLLATFAALILLHAQITNRLGLSVQVGVVLLFLPAVTTLAACFVWHPRVFLQLCNLREPADPTAVGNDELESLAKELRTAMELPESTRVIITKELGCAPLATAAWRQGAVVLLPSNLLDDAIKACDGDRALASQLVRLVLAHEMAHIRNGDVWMLPLLAAIRGPVGWLFCLGGVYLAISLGLLERASLSIVWPAIVMFSVGGAITQWLLSSLIAERERLADATASVFIGPRVLRSLVDRADTEALAPLQKFLLLLRVRNIFSHSFLGFTMPNEVGVPWPWRKTPATQFTHRVSRRSSALASKSDVFSESFDLSVTAAFAAGFLAAFSLVSFEIAQNLALLHKVIQVGGVHSNKVFMGLLPLSNAVPLGLGWRIFQDIGNVIVGMVLAGFLLVPVRDAANGFYELTGGKLKQLAVRILLGWSVFTVSYGIIRSLTFPDFLIRSPLSWGVVPTLMWSLVAGMAFSGAVGVRNRFLVQQAVRGRLAIIGALAAVSVVMVIALFLPSSLTISGRLLWGLAVCILVAPFAYVRPMRFLAYQNHRADEWLRARTFLGKTILQTTEPGPAMPERSDDARFLIQANLLTVILPGLLVFLVVVYALQFFDAFYWEHYPRLPHQFQALLDHFVGPGRLFPSTALGLWLLTMLGAWTGGRTAVWMLRGGITAAKLHRQVVLLAELMHVAPDCLSALSSLTAWRASVEATLLHFGREGFVTGWHGIPLQRHTCQWIEFAHGFEVGAEVTSQMKKWVMKCQDNHGGFGGAPGLRPDLLHTASSLRMLKTVEFNGEVLREQHEAWATMQIKRLVSQGAVDNSTLWLETMSLAIESHGYVAGSLSAELRERVVEECNRNWRSCRKLARDARNALMILNGAGVPANAPAEELRRGRARQWELSLPTFKHDSMEEELLNRLWVLRLIYPTEFEQRPAVIQALDNIVRVAKKAAGS